MWTISPMGVLEIVFRTSVIYSMLLIGIRLTGKREVGQLTPFDFVLLLVVSNAVQNAMIGSDTSLSGGLIAMGTLLGLNALVAKAGTKFPLFRRFVDGVPTVLVAHGMVQWGNLRRENISEDELMASLREHEVENLEDVSLAMIEVDGGISVIRKADSDGDGDDDDDDGDDDDKDSGGLPKFIHSHRKRRHHIRKANG